MSPGASWPRRPGCDGLDELRCHDDRHRRPPMPCASTCRPWGNQHETGAADYSPNGRLRPITSGLVSYFYCLLLYGWIEATV